MKKPFLIIMFFSLAIQLSQAQLWKMRRYEATAGFGPSVFFGDIGGYSKTKNILGIRDMSFLQTRFNFTGNVKFRIIREANVRLNLSYALLHATDKRGSNEERGFEALSSIFEPSVIGEYYFIKNASENSYLFLTRRDPFIRQLIRSLDFYAFAGIGGVSYRVKGNDALIERGMTTGGFAAVIPVGIGATLIYSPDINFGVELGGRYAFTDYLDGFTSQYSKSNDVYYFFNVSITYKLRTGSNGLPVFR